MLTVGHSYYLNGMHPSMWDAPHPLFGAPFSLAGRYLGSLCGRRCWHGFEVWVDGEEHGVIFMTDADLEKLHVVHVDDVCLLP